MSYKLLLVRHGESEWNAKNLFTGWVDVSLSEKGISEAKNAGKLIKEKDILPDVVHTSLLRRAIKTANIALDIASRHWIPVKRSWRLNERHYGALQGKNKSEVRDEFGEEQFMVWRRSYDVPPPPISKDSKYYTASDVRYKGAPVVLTESLALVLERALPYFKNEIINDLKDNKVVMVAAHGNSIRALVKYLDGVSDSEIAGVNIPTGIPLLYELNSDFKPIKAHGTYLDPNAALDAIKAVASQGKK
jgi:2,3-bisphosphoglycerate-dependent phosphoglycerate mutase